jgi:hypothetical protein
MSSTNCLDYDYDDEDEEDYDLISKKSLPDLAVEQGPNGGWEFAKLSFPRWH